MTELIAIMSPTCSIAGAIATGMMNRIAPQWNSGATKSGMAMAGAAETGAKSTSPRGSETP